VEFPDPGLEKAIRDALEVSDDYSITITDLQGLADLNARGYGITDLSGIEACENLESLTLWYNEIADIAQLATLTKLSYLDLDNNYIADLSPLAELAHLVRLYASSNPIADLSPLADISTLRYLSVDAVDVDDWSPIAHLTSLATLSASGNDISSIVPFAELDSLTALYLVSNDIVDISALASLSNLESLALGDNRIEAVDALASLPNLKALALADNRIEDVDTLASLTQLCSLDLSGNLIQDISVLSNLIFADDCEDGAYLGLSDNGIVDLTPLLSIESMGSEFGIDVRGNPAVAQPVADEALDVIEQIENAGAAVRYLTPLEVGAAAPNFTLANLESTANATLSDFRSYIVILDFWASWCGPCRNSLPTLDALAAQYDDEVVLLGINLDREEADAIDFLQNNPMPKMFVLRGSYDEANAVSLAYGDLLSNGIPQSFVIDGNGTIVYAGHPSGITQEFLQGLVDSSEYQHGWLGVQIADITDEIAEAYSLEPSQAGAFVVAVIPGDPAELAGVQEADIVIQIGDSPIQDVDNFIRVVGSMAPGSDAELVIIRAGATITLTATLGTRS
ncbi:leucine-rich repeat domain-containing protein, partial [Candidatus Bipolaricaulota bacterium]|nr:leucine-rich repeat domain-containing protein [Candidatus Bipolaricaulota bacterium]